MDVLVVRVGALGDIILTLPLLASIRTAQPDAALNFVANRAYLDLVPPGIHCRAIDHRDQLWLFSESTEELGCRPVYDLAYVILNNPISVVNNLKRAGSRSIHQVSARPMAGKHMVEHIHAGLGMPVPPRRPALTHLASGHKGNFFWIHPGSGGQAKCLPLEFFVSLSKLIQKCTGWDIVVTAGEEDEFLTGLPEWEALINQPRSRLFKYRPLSRLCKELSSAQFFVGNDSGMSHLAAGLGIRSATFFLTTDPKYWAPWVPEDQLRVIDCRSGLPSLMELERQLIKFL